MIHKVEVEFGTHNLIIETGRLARQADGSALVRYADTVVLVTAVSAPEEREGVDFFPLTVDYREKAYAAGKIPGGFFKREGAPKVRETLVSRLIDRPIRPLFPKEYCNETQVIAFVLSSDQENDPDVLAIIGASTALTVSDIPFAGPIAAVRVGRIAGEFIINPTLVQLQESELDIVVAGTKDAVVMVEGASMEVDEELLVQAIALGHEALQPAVKAQEDLQLVCGRAKRTYGENRFESSEITDIITNYASPLMPEALLTSGKNNRANAVKKIWDNLLEKHPEWAEDEIKFKYARNVFEEIEKKSIRDLVLNKKTRVDKRRFDEIRDIEIEIGWLPRTHGSAIFTRGETQCMAVLTLGTISDEQRVDDMLGESSKSFMLHYNFPPFSAGEARFMRAPGRREIGHGNLAERAVSPVIPPNEIFPYTIRIVSDITESNGSTSMATVCGATLSLMDAGVPIKAPVSGIAMGLMTDNENNVVLSDILGTEDHAGDMDFKVAGTRNGVTAIQMDLKVTGISTDTIRDALEQARKGRLHILERMEAVIAEPRENLPKHAPRIIIVDVPREKIGDVIGPGGKTIRSIIEQSGVEKIDISDEDAKVYILANDGESAAKAERIISRLTEEATIGKVYSGVVKRVEDYGAFIEILPGKDGLLHVSQYANHRIRDIRNELKEGDELEVKLIDIDDQGRLKLSRKVLLDPDVDVESFIDKPKKPFRPQRKNHNHRNKHH